MAKPEPNLKILKPMIKPDKGDKPIVLRFFLPLPLELMHPSISTLMAAIRFTYEKATSELLIGEFDRALLPKVHGTTYINVDLKVEEI